MQRKIVKAGRMHVSFPPLISRARRRGGVDAPQPVPYIAKRQDGSRCQGGMPER
jgi:hypothetical protein